MIRLSFCVFALTCAAAALPSRAAVYTANYTADYGTTATEAMFAFTTSDTLNTVGGYDILSLTGNVNGSAITGLVPNPNAPAKAIVAGYSFDNVYYDKPQILDNDGILFQTANGREYNFWNNYDPTYTLAALFPAADGSQEHTTGFLGTPKPPVPRPGAETIFVSPLRADGGVTTGLYSGRVRVMVSGFAAPDVSSFADAFYLLDRPNPDPYPYEWQLTFGTHVLHALTGGQTAALFIEGGRPAFQPSHIYDFVLDTRTQTPSYLHFGFDDDRYDNNSGGYTVSVSAFVPEPQSWAMMLAGFGIVGSGLRRRQNAITPRAYAAPILAACPGATLARCATW